MSEDQLPTTTSQPDVSPELHDKTPGEVSSGYDRAVVAKLGENRIGDLLEYSVDNDYGKGNPKIVSDLESRMRIIREIVTKNGRNSKEELLGTEELILWAGESGDPKEKTIRAYSVYLYLKEEIAGIPEESREAKKDYIIFLQEKILELSGVIGSSKRARPTLLGKILPTVRKYALAVTSVIALGSLGYARHLKSENNDIQGDYTQTSSLLENERQTNSDLEREVQRLEKEKIGLEKEKKSIVEKGIQDGIETTRSQNRLSAQLTDKSNEYQKNLRDKSVEYSQKYIDLKAENTRIRDNSEFAINKILDQIKFSEDDAEGLEHLRQLQLLRSRLTSSYFFTKSDAIRFEVNPDDETIKFNMEVEPKYFTDPKKVREIKKMVLAAYPYEWLTEKKHK